MLTNFRTVRASIKRLKELEDMAASNTYEKISKKEILQLSREQEKLEKTLGGIKEMGGLPDALFVIDVGYEKIAVQEAAKLGIPVVGIVDTNNSPDNIDYIVPGNDDSMRAIKLYTRMVADAVLDGKQSIAGGADGDAELIEVDQDAPPAAAKPAVKVTAKKAAVAAEVASKNVDSEVETSPEESVVSESAAEESVAEEVVAQDEPAGKTAADADETVAEAAPKKAAAKKSATKKAATKKAATKKAAPKKAATKKAATKKAATKKAAVEE